MMRGSSISIKRCLFFLLLNYILTFFWEEKDDSRKNNYSSLNYGMLITDQVISKKSLSSHVFSDGDILLVKYDYLLN